MSDAPQKPAATPTAARPVPRSVADKRNGEMPDYTRSLLRIRVPVEVTLAESRTPLKRIIELGPGSILQFEKSCEDMLELSVAGRPIALGEAVKVGDKFGLRITSIILPGERFKPLKPKK
jgi:flagellar motor switch protein FliN